MRILLLSVFLFFPMNLGEARSSFIPEECVITNEILPLEKNTPTNLMTIFAIVNGKPCTLLFDTGASHTTFDAEFIATQFPAENTIPIEQSGSSNVWAKPRAFFIKELTLGQNTHKSFYGVVLDLKEIRKAMNMKIDGILGRNCLAAAPFLFSAKNKIFQWVGKLPEKRTLPAQQELNVSSSPSGGILVHAHRRDNEETIRLLLDTGASFTCVPKDIWEEDPKGKHVFIAATDINGVDDQVSKMNRGRKADFIFTPRFSVKNFSPMLLKEGTISLLGMDFLSRYDMAVDFSIPNIILSSPQTR